MSVPMITLPAVVMSKTQCAAEATQYRDQSRVTTSARPTVPPTPQMPRVRPSATVLMKMVGCNVATPADTSGTPAPSSVTRTFGTNAAMYAYSTPTPAAAAMSL